MVILIIIFFLFARPALCQSDPSEIAKQISVYTQKLDVLSRAKDSLSNQIKILDLQAAQTALKIKQTESSIATLQTEIAALSSKIGQIDISLNQLSAIFIEQINQNYRLHKRLPYLSVFLSGNLNDFFEQYKYLSRVQKESQDTLLEMETIRTNLDTQKQVKAKKQSDLTLLESQLQKQKKDLTYQKTSKSNLLQATKNDEARYQTLLRQAQSELTAIEAILVGNGEEVEVGQVTRGSKIGSVIQGPSCSSSGTHLHFMVKLDNIAQNPFSYLKAGISYQDNSSGDAFNPSGSWEWPIKEKIEFNQGYGKTWSIAHTWVGRIYSFHNGIDITSQSSQDIIATFDGTLFRGRINAGGCTLKYVRVQSKEKSNLSTLGLHVNYF